MAVEPWHLDAVLKKKGVNLKTSVCRVAKPSDSGTPGSWHSLQEQKFIKKYCNPRSEVMRTYVPCSHLISKENGYRANDPCCTACHLSPPIDPATTYTTLSVRSFPGH